MKKVITILLLMLALAAQAQSQSQQISYIEETKNWYYVYDEKAAGYLLGARRERKSVQEVPIEKSCPHF